MPVYMIFQNVITPEHFRTKRTLESSLPCMCLHVLSKVWTIVKCFSAIVTDQISPCVVMQFMAIKLVFGLK